MNKTDLEYLRDVLATEHTAQSEEPSATAEIAAAIKSFQLQAEVETLAAREITETLH
ncbi:hypothetical protein NHF40_06435 [Maricaulaceae bacterium EIL42A08]|nr:hypothetical protein [Maricaulaceae bacterium EIL42A08]